MAWFARGSPSWTRRCEAVETPVFILHLAYRTDTLNQAYQTGLMTLAATTGGTSYFCRSQTEIPDAMGKAFEAITSQYSLAGCPPGGSAQDLGCNPGKPRLVVDLARPVCAAGRVIAPAARIFARFGLCVTVLFFFMAGFIWTGLSFHLCSVDEGC